MMQIRYEYELKRQLKIVNGLLLLNTWTNWSMQCRTMYKVMQKITPRLSGEDAIAFIDWHRHREVASSLCVYGVPTLIIFSHGREVERFSGVTNEAILQNYIEVENKTTLQGNDQAKTETKRETK